MIKSCPFLPFNTWHTGHDLVVVRTLLHGESTSKSGSSFERGNTCGYCATVVEGQHLILDKKPQQKLTGTA